MDACAHGVHILAYECFCVFFSVVFVAHFDALMTGVGSSHIKHCGFPTQIQKTNNSLAPDGTIFSIMTSALCGCPLLLSSGIKMCNKHLQQKKRSISWNVYSLSLTHTHTHTHTHRDSWTYMLRECTLSTAVHLARLGQNVFLFLRHLYNVFVFY